MSALASSISCGRLGKPENKECFPVISEYHDDDSAWDWLDSYIDSQNVFNQ